MAINIFQGGSSKKQSAVNSASASSRAQQAKSALIGQSEVSDSGSTAVKTQGTMSKVKNFVGKTAGVLSKFLPGIGGTLAKGVADVFNDPEWWQQIPGDAATLNNPLVPIRTGILSSDSEHPVFGFRAVMGEFVSVGALWATQDNQAYVIDPNDQMVTQYLMPQIRKVVNAVPLQDARHYRNVLRVQASAYALWRNLKKFDYILKHGQTYIPNLNVNNFPVFQVENAAWLQSTINRLEEYLRANVRLPHTLCEYLAWRYGRVYKSCNSAKAGLIMYNVLPIKTDILTWNAYIANITAQIAMSPESQKANTDLYNAYFDHDLMVEIRDDTQFSYDAKEFCLRTNLDVRDGNTGTFYNEPDNLVYVDSALDNPTTFMASTVSSVGKDPSGYDSYLFPVRAAGVYIKQTFDSENVTKIGVKVGTSVQNIESGSNGWFDISIGYTAINIITEAYANNIAMFILKMASLKTLDIYNKEMLCRYELTTEAGSTVTVEYDVSALSMDCGSVTDAVLGNEHVYAFANLVDISRKHTLSYAKAEKLVAKDVANLVDTMDVAAVATPAGTPAK